MELKKPYFKAFLRLVQYLKIEILRESMFQTYSKIVFIVDGRIETNF